MRFIDAENRQTAPTSLPDGATAGRPGNPKVELRAGRTPGMALEMERTCPVCAEARTFYRAASMNLHLGEKVKWRCSECGYSFVRVDDAVDTGSA